ncbi:Gfo/Idh/MocA family protein [Sinosporangium siamense]|uniref:Oxidoreductase n=1 Tax=Sinosporangium siamense TaxID=1367973 RepID=A0A919V373_9ACTN|nr:Gfo/Idh/MocA family oxidoreductase [Sinosporangium siamense]GII90675.1 oxidoreductase [Sinosporangium siamense]
MKVEPVRMGVISGADIAWRRTVPAMLASRNVELLAVASRDAGKAERFARRFGCDPVVGYDGLLERDDVEAVYIPLPTGLRRQWVERSLAAGKHVLAEKPLATGHAEAEALVEAAETLGLTLAENLTFTAHSQHATVHRLLAEGAVGELRAFTSDFGIPPRAVEDFRARPELGGGALLEVGVYPIRAAQLFLGPELEVRGASLTHDRPGGVDVGGAALFASAEGLTAQIGFGFRHSYRSVYTLWGEKGTLTVNRAFTPPDTLRPVVRIERQDHVEEITLDADGQFVNALDAFAQAVREGKGGGLGAESMLAQARLVDGIRAFASMESPLPRNP